MDYTNLMSIDTSNLEVECVNQARNYYLISSQLAEANKKFDDSALALKMKRSEIALIYKDSQSKKPTANDIENFVNCHEDVVKLEVQKIEAEHTKNVLFGILKGLDHKRDMLKILGWSNKSSENMV